MRLAAAGSEEIAETRGNFSINLRRKYFYRKFLTIILRVMHKFKIFRSGQIINCSDKRSTVRHKKVTEEGKMAFYNLRLRRRR